MASDEENIIREVKSAEKKRKKINDTFQRQIEMILGLFNFK